MRLRELRASDREAIARIVSDVGVFRPDEIEVAMELVDLGLSRDTQSPDPEGYLFAIAEGDDGAVLGYACWGHAPMTDGVYDLYWIAVAPALHGHGVGRALLAACEDDVRSRGGRLLLIETEGSASYDATRAFYLRAGYPELARIPDYYRVGADKIVYGRTLR